VAPPVAQRATPTTGIVAAVTAARTPIDIVQPRTPSSSEKAPQARAKAHSPYTSSTCSWPVPGSHCTIRP
jgi:hypothetical protein